MATYSPETDEFTKRGPCARGIVIHEGKLLAMWRSKPGREDYIVLPGGHIDEGETPEETVLREIPEETTVQVANPRKVFIEDAVDGKWGQQDIYLCDYVSGEPMLSEDSPEYQIQQSGQGIYRPHWIVTTDFWKYAGVFMSPLLAAALTDAFENGFPDRPVRLNDKFV